MLTRSAVLGRYPSGTERRRDAHSSSEGKTMDDNNDIHQMSDPDFLSERARVREAVEALQERLAELDDEFIKRARSAWTEAVK